MSRINILSLSGGSLRSHPHIVDQARAADSCRYEQPGADLRLAKRLEHLRIAQLGVVDAVEAACQEACSKSVEGFRRRCSRPDRRRRPVHRARQGGGAVAL